MRDHSSDRQTAAGMLGCLAIVLGLMFFIGILVVVAGVIAFTYARAHVARQQAVAEEQRAVAETMRARMEMELERAQLRDPALEESAATSGVLTAETTPSRREQAGGTVEIRMDREGNIAIDGRVVSLQELPATLQRITNGPPSALVVVLRVDRQCPIAHVTGILQMCRGIGIEDIQLRAAGMAADTTNATR